jgi:hypothetical protein
MTASPRRSSHGLERRVSAHHVGNHAARVPSSVRSGSTARRRSYAPCAAICIWVCVVIHGSMSGMTSFHGAWPRHASLSSLNPALPPSSIWSARSHVTSSVGRCSSNGCALLVAIVSPSKKKRYAQWRRIQKTL